MAASLSRNGGWDSNFTSNLQHQNAFQQRSATMPSGTNPFHLHRLQAASSEELLHMTENCGGLSAVGITVESSGNNELFSLFATANNFVSAVQAMDKHVMIPNRLRDHRLPHTSTATLSHHTVMPTSTAEPRSRHASGQSMGAGSMAGGLSLSSECSDPVAEPGPSELAVNDELSETDLYSCYRLLNTIKNELLLSGDDENDGQSGHDSCESDSEREQNRSVTPKEELVMFSARTNSADDAAAATTLTDLSAPVAAAVVDQAAVSSDSSRRSSRRMTETSASVSLPASATDAVRRRFRMHLRGLMSILSQLTETANMMTNYYDRCLIPGGSGTTTLLGSSSQHALSQSSSLVLPQSTSSSANNFGHSMSVSHFSSQSAAQSSGAVDPHIFQPTRLF